MGSSHRNTNRTRLLVAFVACCAGLAAFVSTGFGQDRANRNGHGASAATAFGSAKVSAAARGVRIVYVRRSGRIAPGQFGQETLLCPRNFPHPISGFFDSDSEQTYLATSRPDPDGVSAKRARKWAEGVTNAGTTEAGVTIGAVCAR
jgi:hypothetical protein